MKTSIFSYNRYSFLRDVATLCLLGILAGYILPIPVIAWRILFVLLCFYALWERRNRLMDIEKYMFILVGLCSFYFLVALAGITPPSTTGIGAILFTMPACNLYHLLEEKGVITQRWINIFIVLFLLAGAYFYRYNYIKTIERILEHPDEEFDITNNASTVFLALIPFIMLSKNRIVQWSGMLVCWFYLLSSAKRGNILGASLPTILFLLPYLKESRHSFWKMILLVVGLVVAIWFGTQWFEQNFYLQSKIERAVEGGDSSGRDYIYSYYLNEWVGSKSVLTLIFGHGFQGTLVAGGIDTKAHNDWIETLFDYGLFGLFFEFMIFVSFIRLLRRKTNGRVLMAGSVFIWLEKSMFSMGYMDPLNSFMYVALGIVLGRYYNNKQNIPLEYKI